ncbi:MAG TPA: DUF1972 domain-containing protein [bacterium]
MPEKPTKLAIIGSRGIPGRYGGFETFAEKIAMELSKSNIETVVYCMSHLKNEPFNHRGIKRVFIPTLKIPSLEKLLLSSLSLLHATFMEKVDIIIGISTTGGALLWLPRLFNKKIILSFDGIEWARSRWNKILSYGLKTLEFFSVKFADVIIADSKAIGEYITSEYQKESVYIPYGSENCSFTEKNWTELKEEFNLSQKTYYLAVGRFVPENNFSMIINGLLNSDTDKKLVVVSDTIPPETMEHSADKRVIFTGPIYDREKLFALRKYAFAHIHGHSVGGTNPSLLEAIASENLILCYDVPYNREVVESYGYYFKNEEELKDLINLLEKNPADGISVKRAEFYKKILKEKYNWSIISERYLKIINRLTGS